MEQQPVTLCSDLQRGVLICMLAARTKYHTAAGRPEAVAPLSIDSVNCSHQHTASAAAYADPPHMLFEP